MFAFLRIELNSCCKKMVTALEKEEIRVRYTESQDNILKLNYKNKNNRLIIKCPYCGKKLEVI
jgi:hypothetical protein